MQTGDFHSIRVSEHEHKVHTIMFVNRHLDQSNPPVTSHIAFPSKVVDHIMISCHAAGPENQGETLRGHVIFVTTWCRNATNFSSIHGIHKASHCKLKNFTKLKSRDQFSAHADQFDPIFPLVRRGGKFAPGTFAEYRPVESILARKKALHWLHCVNESDDDATGAVRCECTIVSSQTTI